VVSCKRLLVTAVVYLDAHVFLNSMPASIESDGQSDGRRGYLALHAPTTASDC
jgi:hypothetical protein